jgi:hypothetical protein
MISSIPILHEFVLLRRLRILRISPHRAPVLQEERERRMRKSKRDKSDKKLENFLRTQQEKIKAMIKRGG